MVDPDGLSMHWKGLRQQEPNFGDWIRVSAFTAKRSTNRFREVTVDGPKEISAAVITTIVSVPEIASHSPFRRQVKPTVAAPPELFASLDSRADFPELIPSGQGELDGHMPVLYLSPTRRRFSLARDIGRKQRCHN